MTDITIMSFKRREQKYLISEDTKRRLLERIAQNIVPDPYGVSTVFSLYLDTPDHRMIRESVDARAHGDAYRVKLRLRSYGTPAPTDRVYIELKQKCLGTVYKRRVGASLDAAYRYFADGVMPESSQIMNEIDYIMRCYDGARPSFLICCEREAYFSNCDRSLRLTFDEGVRYRANDPWPERGSDGKPLLDRGMLLLEIKTASAVPYWLADALMRENIYPISYSKYAAAYADSLISIKNGELIWST